MSRQSKSNQPLLDELSEQQRATVLNGSDALSKITNFRRITFDLWMDIARGVAILAAIADRPGMSRKARTNLFKDNGYGSLNPSTVSRLLWMAKLETRIRVWRDSGELTEHQRDSWNSPTSICNRCPDVRKEIEAAKRDRPRREPKKQDATQAIEKALDVIGDLAFNLKDADHRAAIKERLLRFAAQFGEPGKHVEKAEPKPKPKAKAKPEPKAEAEPLWEGEAPRDVDHEEERFGRRVKRYSKAEQRQAEKTAKAVVQSLIDGLKPEPKPKATKAALRWKAVKDNRYEARLANGAHYTIGPVVTNVDSLTPIGYVVHFYLSKDGTLAEGFERLGEVRDLETAKAIAEAHHHSRNKTTTKPKPKKAKRSKQ